MRDLFSLQVKHMDSVLGDTEQAQADDLISKAVFEINSSTNFIMESFREHRYVQKPLDEKVLKEKLLIATKWITTLLYCLNLDPPEMEDVENFASSFEKEIAADAVLSCLHIQMSLGELALDYFCDQDSMSIESIDQSIGEMLACIELLSRRVNSSLSGLIMKV